MVEYACNMLYNGSEIYVNQLISIGFSHDDYNLQKKPDFSGTFPKIEIVCINISQTSKEPLVAI